MYSFSVRPTFGGIIPPAEQQNPAASRISSGDDARFRSVVLPHLGDAYSLARWVTGNQADAEGVVQEACLRAFRGIGNFSNGNARVWVLTIVRDTAYTWLRQNHPSAILVIEDLEGVETAQANPGDPDGESSEKKLVAKADAAGLQAAIGALLTPYRETMILRDVQGLSYREIAEVTGVSTGTVMSRLARARHKLITFLAKNEARIPCDAATSHLICALIL